MIPVHRGDMLGSVLPFWKELSSREHSAIMEKGILSHYKQGQSVHRGGSDCAGLLVVITGQIRIFYLSDSGKEITLYRLFDRDVCILSSSCIMKNITFDVQVEAEKDSHAILIPTAVFQQLTQTNSAVKDFTTEIVASRLSDVMWIMEQVVFMSFDKRLANFLLEQSSIEASDRISMTHERIARNLGSAREVVTRMLKYFQSEEMVSLTRGGVTITDRKKLMDRI